MVKKITIVKSDLDRMLVGLLGRHELVDQWWTSCNLAFEGKTPLETYQSTDQNRQKVIDYITFHAMV